MPRRSHVWLLLVGGVLVFIRSGTQGGELPVDRRVGKPVSDFTLKDTQGKPTSLYSFAGKKAVVLFFMGQGCPLSELYLPRFAELAATYSKRNVIFLAIDSNRKSDPEKVAETLRQAGVNVPVLVDPGNVVADLLFVERTCETLVIDGSDAALRYRGAIDDQYLVGKRRQAPDNRYLVDALDDLLAGRAVRVRSSPVAGCPIERIEPKQTPTSRKAAIRPTEPAAVQVGAVNYMTHVAPVLRQKCQCCHSPGKIGPFPLLTYEQARQRGAAIREVVEDGRMPPWHADPAHGTFKNDRSLSPRERATLLAWVDQQMPRGEGEQGPAAPPAGNGWQIGTPDLVFEMPEEYVVAAQGVLAYQDYRVRTRFDKDMWVQAAEARPGDRSVVHHIVIYLDDHKDEPERTHFCAYAPGHDPLVFPEGTAKRIPAGADLIFEMHYTPIGRARSDRSSVGLVLAKKPVTREAMTVGIANEELKIPPGHDNAPVEATFTVPRDATLFTLFPHMHLRGKDFRYEATYPGGRKEVLLHVPAYDFAWQTQYVLAQPKALPKGTRIDCLAHYDNSAKNPANPDPKREVIWGPQTTDEMMIGYIELVVPVRGK